MRTPDPLWFALGLAGAVMFLGFVVVPSLAALLIWLGWIPGCSWAGVC